MSLWIATGTPYSLIVASKSGCTISLPVSPSNPWQRSKYRLYPSLIVNGVHYNRSAVPRVEVAARREGANWILDVSDNGIGIATDYLAEIFKPLVRLHTASEYSGSGLGLTLARKAIVAQKGEIWCESTPGHGTVFHVRLPSAEGRREEKRKRQAPPGRRKAGA